MPETPDMPCDELVEVITAYIEDRLPADDLIRLEAHLEVCAACRMYIAQFRVTIERSGHLPVRPLPAETQETLLNVFRGWNAA